MSLTIRIEAIRSPDEKWEKMKAVWDACEEAGVSVPHEVEEYFNHREPDGSGVALDLVNDQPEWIEEWCGHYYNGYEVLLEHMPKDISRIRFSIG